MGPTATVDSEDDQTAERRGGGESTSQSTEKAATDVEKRIELSVNCEFNHRYSQRDRDGN